MSTDPQATAGESGTHGVRDDGLHPLAMRLLAYNSAGMPGPEETRLIVGDLPPDLPEPLPVPPGARVLGCVVRGREQIDAALDTDLTPEAVLAFYREQLAAAGWAMPEEVGGMGAFAHGGSARNVVFCRSARGPALTFDAVAAPTGTQVRLGLQVRAGHRCGGGHHHDLFARIPRLVPPPGGDQRAMGGSGGGDSAHATARLVTDRDLAALAAHYRVQLERAGWVPGDAGEAGQAAWCAYTFADEDGARWRGLLDILQWPGKTGVYLLRVWVEMDEADTSEGAWEAWASGVGPH